MASAQGLVTGKCFSFSIPPGAEHDGDGRFGLVERLCGGGLLQFHRPARAGGTEAPGTSLLLLIHPNISV